MDGIPDLNANFGISIGYRTLPYRLDDASDEKYQPSDKIQGNIRNNKCKVIQKFKMLGTTWWFFLFSMFILRNSDFKQWFHYS